MKNTRRLLALLLALLMLTALLPSALGEEAEPEIEIVAEAAEEAAEEIDVSQLEPELEIVPAPALEEGSIEEEIEVVPAPEPEEEEEASPFVIEDGVLTACLGDDAEVLLPEDVTVIAAYAFADHVELVRVVCPEGLEAIEDYAFSGCAALAAVEFPETAVVGERAFEGCPLLAQGEIPGSEELRSRAPVIVTQPADAAVPLGGSVTLSIVATGTGLSYQWQYLTPGASAWTNCTSAAAKAPSWTFAVTKEAWSGRQYRCIITDANGDVTKSKRMTLTVGNVAPAAPSDVTLSGKAASLVVKWSPVSGANAYNVYYGTGTSISKASTISVTASQATIPDLTYDKTYYVWVKAVNSAGAGEASARASLKLVKPPVITAQPRNVSVRLGETATLSCTATGTDLSYRWQYTNAGGNTWIDCTSAAAYAASWSFKVTKEAWNGRQYRCTITDGIGNVQKTNRMTLTIEDAAPVINAQPEDVTVADGASATVFVTATGTGLTYQWQYRAGSSGSWISATSAAAKAASWTFAAKAAWTGRQYRCAVTNAGGITRYSSPMTLTVGAAPTVIKAQPKDVTVSDGQQATLSITAVGTGLTYQWQYLNPDATAWTNASSAAARSDNWTFTAKYSFSGRQYRCVITNADGAVTKSNRMTLTVNIAPTVIQVQPQDVTVGEGQKETISITATGSGLSYKWQYLDPGASAWTDVNGITTAAWVTTGDLGKNGRQYRCVITNVNGAVTKSNRMTLTVTPAAPIITVQPKDVTVAEGQKGVISITAVGSGLSYVWQYLDPGQSSWTKVNGVTTSSWAVTGDLSKNGRQYRCKVSNVTGTVTSNPMTLTVTERVTIAIDAAHFPDDAFRNWVSENCDADGDGELSPAEVEAVTEIDCCGMGIADLTGIRILTALEYLGCSENDLTALDLSGCSSLIELSGSENSLTELDLSGCSELKNLGLSYNHLTTLDLSDCPELVTLSCDENSLTQLDLSGYTMLEELYCSNNSLTQLDLSGCSALTDLNCNGNRLTSLDLSDCPALERLECRDNALTTLDLSNCPALQRLSCFRNALTSLDLSGCSELYELSCSHNQLTDLDLSGCLDPTRQSALVFLNCSNNALSRLDLTGCIALQELYCNNNALTGLDLSPCPSLTWLSCTGNALTRLDLTVCPYLEDLSCDDGVEVLR